MFFFGRYLIALCLLVSLSSCVSSVKTDSQKNSAHNQDALNTDRESSSIVYDATEDFPQISAGDIPYYIDNLNDSLAIDARIHEYRNLFARATRIFDGPSGEYDITISLLTEEDGESLYRLLVNDQVVSVHRNDYIGHGSPRDLTEVTHTWTNISLKNGDVIGVESNAHTNTEIPELGGTAWARGRWQQLTLDVTGSIDLPRPDFKKHKDILVAQFDLKPDADDVHTIAALGSMLVHPDMEGINLIAVAGSVGTQGGEYIDASNLLTNAVGQENFRWTDAHKNWESSVNMIHDRARAVLAQGGVVWVQEAGQSDFTRDWISALIESGIHESIVKNNVIVVQHSIWNEEQTSAEDLAYVKAKAHYQQINDGNRPMRIFDRDNRRGPFTPEYVNASEKWIKAAISEENSREHARQLWREADNLIQQSGFDGNYSVIPQGGVDFSDLVESWWILDLGQKAVSVHAFWERYVTDVQLDNIKPPEGRLAVVIDGNSPDPDDIGATPIMFALLQQAGLRDRLVHLSHSCDLDPSRNKGYQIDAENELRRQKVLHQLSGDGIELFGPFNNLRDYYNCRVDQAGAEQDLVEAINASSADDPLWIIEAGEPDLIGYALQAANPEKIKYVHVVSHHPANDDSGDFFSWQQILDFGVTEHQIGDQNIGLQTPTSSWDWAKNHENPGIAYIWEMMAYAERDGIVPFQANKFDCSDAGMVYWWITGANQGGNNEATPADIKDMLLMPDKLAR